MKKITITIKIKSIVGSTILTSKTTETGDFGYDFKGKEKRGPFNLFFN